MNVPAACGFDVLDGDLKLMTGTLNNYGTLSLLALSQIQMDSGAVINNAGLCETWSDDPFAHQNGGIPTFENTGTFRKLGPSRPQLRATVNFHHRGILDVASNTLSFVAGNHTVQQWRGHYRRWFDAAGRAQVDMVWRRDEHRAGGSRQAVGRRRNDSMER